MLALRAGVFFPLLVAVRSAYQGVLVGRRRSAPIAVGTFLRLLFLAIMVFTVVPRVPWGGPVAAVLALAAAVLVETIYVIVLTMRTPEKEEGPSPAHEAGRRLSGKVRFLAPLAWTMVLGSLTNPLVNAFIARTPNPEQGLAVFSVVASLIWFMASSVLRFSSVTIALGTTRANLRRLERFVWRYVGSVCAAVFLVTLTPAARHPARAGHRTLARARRPRSPSPRASLAAASGGRLHRVPAGDPHAQRPHRGGRVRGDEPRRGDRRDSVRSGSRWECAAVFWAPSSSARPSWPSFSPCSPYAAGREWSGPGGPALERGFRCRYPLRAPTRKGRRPVRTLLIVLLYALLVLTLHVAGVLAPTPANWGVHHYGFLPGAGCGAACWGRWCWACLVWAVARGRRAERAKPSSRVPGILIGLVDRGRGRGALLARARADDVHGRSAPRFARYPSSPSPE